MSEAFDRAMEEVGRLGEASDHFDTKVLQFIGIVAAGSLAAAAIVVKTLPGVANFDLAVLMVSGVGAAALLAFFGLALFSSMGRGFAGPIDPRELEKIPALPHG